MVAIAAIFLFLPPSLLPSLLLPPSLRPSLLPPSVPPQFTNHFIITLDAQKCRESSDEILRMYAIPSHCSQDLIVSQWKMGMGMGMGV